MIPVVVDRTVTTGQSNERATFLRDGPRRTPAGGSRNRALARAYRNRTQQNAQSRLRCCGNAPRWPVEVGAIAGGACSLARIQVGVPASAPSQCARKLILLPM